MRKKINRVIVSYRHFTEAAYASGMGMRRVGVVLSNLIVSFYLALIVILHSFGNVEQQGLKITIACGLLLFLIIYQLLKFFIIKCRGKSLFRHEKREKLSWKVFAFSAIITLVIFGISFFAHYPGGASPDNVDQWQQVLSGEFNNWHPAIHTMIMWLVTRIVPTYSFFVGVQILSFSLLTGYMAATFAAWGIKKGWLIAFLLTIISTRSTRGILLYPWKDTALTLCLLCLAIYIVNIVFSDGKWLNKWRNVIVVAIVGAIASLVRHNGFFFTMPLGVLVIVFYRKTTRNAIFAVVASFLVILGITKVLYPLVKVEYPPSQTYVESVGVPMTILGGVLTRNPDALDAQTKEFLYKITDAETWQSQYRSGDYNSIKFFYPASSVVAEVPPKELLLMTLRAIKNAPKESLEEVIALTRIVWDPLEWNHTIGISTKDSVFSEEEMEAVQPIKDISGKLYKGYITPLIELSTPARITTSIGLQMLLLILAGIYSLNCNLGWKALLLVLPSVIYNLGTMVLLCGADYRFFHFNVVITLPLIIALLAKKTKADVVTKPRDQIDESENCITLID